MCVSGKQYTTENVALFFIFGQFHIGEPRLLKIKSSWNSAKVFGRRDRNEETPEDEGIGEQTEMGRTPTENE